MAMHNQSGRLATDLSERRFFDPQSEFSVIRRKLPHWTQAGTLCFITWRTWDSFPAPVQEEWAGEVARFFNLHGVSLGDKPWWEAAKRLDAKTGGLFRKQFSKRWNRILDDCHGGCVLRNLELSAAVWDALIAFDEDRYALTDFVVMPNHVHVLAAFPGGAAMLKQCEEWKRFTARRINEALSRRGRFWQSDSFDHLVRSEEQFEMLRVYIVENPQKAGLKDGEYRHFSKKLSTD